MYVYYDKNGLVKEIINNESPHQASVDNDKIYIYVEGTSNVVQGWATFKKADGTYSNEIFSVKRGSYEIPYDAKRDLKHFEYFKRYEMWEITIPQDVLSVNGLTILSFRYLIEEGEGVLRAIDVLPFTIKENAVNVDNNINISQYNYLIRLISTKLGYGTELVLIPEELAELPEKGENNTIYSVLQDNGSRDMFMWNGNEYIFIGSNELNIDYFIAQREKGVANGVAPLDEHKLIPSKYIAGLREYIVKANKSEIDAIPVSERRENVIYIASDTGKEYLWNKSSNKFLEIQYGTPTAKTVTYDNTNSGLPSFITNVQLALDFTISYNDDVNFDKYTFLDFFLSGTNLKKSSITICNFNGTGSIVGRDGVTRTMSGISYVFDIINNENASAKIVVIGGVEKGKDIYTITTENGNVYCDIANSDDIYTIKNTLNDKLNKNALQWATLPEGAVDKKTFYNKTVSTLRTANNKIYMFGTPEETPIKEFFEIWEKPTDFKATHVYIVIESISNTSSRDSFKMTIHSSNYGNMYYMVLNGYSSQLVGTSGWISYNLLSADRQNKLAKNDGSYINMTVGNAEGLIDPRGKDTPTQENQDFSSRVTANGATIEGSSPDTKASLLSVKGQTIAFNQLITQNFLTSNVNKWSKNRCSLTSNGEYATIKPISNQYAEVTIFYKFSMSANNVITKNHIFYGSIDVKNINANLNIFSLSALQGNITANNSSDWQTLEFVQKNTKPNDIYNFNIAFKYNNTSDMDLSTDEYNARKPVFVDLTQCYGVTEVSQVTEEMKQGIKRLLALHPSYNAGTLINSMPTRLTSYGSNLCKDYFAKVDDNKIEYRDFIRVFEGQHYSFKSFGNFNKDQVLVIWYKENKNDSPSIGLNSFGLEGQYHPEAPKGAKYCKIRFQYDNGGAEMPSDGLVKPVLVVGNETPTIYEPYIEPDIVEIPDVGGLNGVNNVYDEITKDKHIKRIEEVDLGSLSWEVTDKGTENERFDATLSLAKDNEGSFVIPNIICDRITISNFESVINHTNDKIITLYSGELWLYDSALIGKTGEQIKAYFNKPENKTYLRYELATPVITKHKLDFEYNAYIGGIEEWTNDGVNPLADFHYYINLRDKLVSLRSANVQEQIDNEQDRRIADLENVTIVNSTEIGNIEVAMEIMPTREQVMINHKFIGNLHDIDLYNQIINTPNVMDGALFRIDIKNDTPRDAVNRGFPNLEQDSVVYGYFYNGQLDSPMIVITDKGMFKIIDGGELTCEVIDGEDFEIEYRVASQHQYNISTPQLAHLIKGLRVWYQYEFQGRKRLQHQDIYFTDKGDNDATSYISNGLNIVGFLADTIALEFDTETGVLALRSTGTMPQTFKLVDLKGLR